MKKRNKRKVKQQQQQQWDKEKGKTFLSQQPHSSSGKDEGPLSFKNGFRCCFWIKKDYFCLYGF